MKNWITTAALMLLLQTNGETQPILTKIAKIAETNQLADKRGNLAYSKWKQQGI